MNKMTKEDIELRIIDLCSRLPYEVKALVNGYIVIVRSIEINPNNDKKVHVSCMHHYRYFYEEIEKVKPYLFPMSSMTGEQREEYNFMVTEELMEIIEDEAEIKPEYKYIDWLNEHHFDYRGLIDKKLAIDCTNLSIY